MNEVLEQFSLEIPTVKLLGTPYCIDDANILFTVDSDVQLVCKYLKAYKRRKKDSGIDRLYKEGKKEVKFSLDPDLPAKKCQKLLQKYMPKHVTCSKITEHLFIK